jgi:hypothetical protein
MGLQTADACGHPDRPGNASGFCDECWENFAGKYGFANDEELTVWENKQRSLSLAWADPPLRSSVFGRRLRAVRAALALQLPVYAALHLKAARIAAEKGDTRPMEWMLTHASVDAERAVDLQKGSADAPDSGVKVFIGVKVGGLPLPDEPPIEAEVVGASGQK